MKIHPKLPGLILLLVWLAGLAGCAGEAGPRLIAAQSLAEGPIATFPRQPQPPAAEQVYHAALELRVADVESAAERAVYLAAGQGGTLVSSQVWYQQDERFSMLVLAVPATHFDSLRRDLLRLGQLEREQISAELSGSQAPAWYAYSQVTVYLRPKSFTWPQLELPTWRPLQTLLQAGSVLAHILGFLLDVLIWVAVLVGPFWLAGWAVRRVWRGRGRKLAP
ncbi:MAG: DUF4349 domain-containing protein [Anaerolineales bacterium]|nr:DUF4349 domain-containing protein [Anaerolineales bacterium]